MDEISRLKELNATTPGFRGMEVCKFLGATGPTCEICKLMIHSSFVIEGETKWDCQRCGKCCQNKLPILLPKITDVETEWPIQSNGHCSFLKDGNFCLSHDAPLSIICTNFPFNAVKSAKNHPEPLILIDSRCPAVGTGRVIDATRYRELRHYFSGKPKEETREGKKL